MHVTKIESLQIERRWQEDMLLDVSERLGFLVERVVTWSYSDGRFETFALPENGTTLDWVRVG